MNMQSTREGTFERSFVVIALLFFSVPFTAMLPADRNNIELATFFSIYIVTIFFIRNTIKDIFIIAKQEKFLICLLLIVIFSTVWSDFPFITFRRSLSLLGSTLFGIYLAEKYTLRKQLYILGTMLGISAVLSLLFSLLLPSYGLSSSHEGAWQGIYDQKNVLGHIMALSSLVFFLLCVDKKEHLWIKFTLLILTFFLLLCSQSMMSLSVTLIMFSFLVLYKSLQWNLYLRDGLFCLYIILVVGTVVLISENQNLILNAMGRSSDLSGRIELWESIIPMIKKRLFFGYGYNAFWIEGGAREYIRYLVEWDTPHSHNGILDVWLDIGLLGVFIFTLSFVQALLNSIKHIKQKNSWEALWPLIYLTFLLLSSFLESTGFVKHNNLYWVLYVSLIMSYYRGIS